MWRYTIRSNTIMTSSSSKEETFKKLWINESIPIDKKENQLALSKHILINKTDKDPLNPIVDYLKWFASDPNLMKHDLKIEGSVIQSLGNTISRTPNYTTLKSNYLLIDKQKIIDILKHIISVKQSVKALVDDITNTNTNTPMGGKGLGDFLEGTSQYGGYVTDNIHISPSPSNHTRERLPKSANHTRKRARARNP